MLKVILYKNVHLGKIRNFRLIPAIFANVATSLLSSIGASNVTTTCATSVLYLRLRPKRLRQPIRWARPPSQARRMPKIHQAPPWLTDCSGIHLETASLLHVGRAALQARGLVWSRGELSNLRQLGRLPQDQLQAARPRSKALRWRAACPRCKYPVACVSPLLPMGPMEPQPQSILLRLFLAQRQPRRPCMRAVLLTWRAL